MCLCPGDLSHSAPVMVPLRWDLSNYVFKNDALSTAHYNTLIHSGSYGGGEEEERDEGRKGTKCRNKGKEFEKEEGGENKRLEDQDGIREHDWELTMDNRLCKGVVIRIIHAGCRTATLLSIQHAVY